ncbi:hypothetical protein A3Q56_03020 [Intoshia linei]|uniref:Phospholipid/glycerol acyltransferase domain-containing protein n=1 Tax=Intoshia linei TaxID=1819745 RepID=A0A177B744_9BILA|nr:hypothetical protein A3Q56_03020 [Intoshia linei]
MSFAGIFSPKMWTKMFKYYSNDSKKRLVIGQSHSGFTGFMQRILSLGQDNIWFERSENQDRNVVQNRLKDHVSGGLKSPILIFPEGTCINNTSTMMFKKGCFTVGGYDPRFADPFWDSSRQSMIKHILMIFTSWALVCDIYYLPPMQKLDSETDIEFAQRVKRVISLQGGFVDLGWDGMLKRKEIKKL